MKKESPLSFFPLYLQIKFAYFKIKFFDREVFYPPVNYFVFLNWWVIHLYLFCFITRPPQLVFCSGFLDNAKYSSHLSCLIAFLEQLYWQFVSWFSVLWLRLILNGSSLLLSRKMKCKVSQFAIVNSWYIINCFATIQCQASGLASTLRGRTFYDSDLNLFTNLKVF